MIIDFNNERFEAFDNFKGGEKTLFSKMYFDGLNRIMHAYLESGASIGMHTHETNSEIIYILDGTGKVIYDGEEYRLESGMCHYCPKGHTHSLINDSDDKLEFFAVVPEQ